MILSCDSSIIVKPTLIKNIGMAFPVEKIVGKLSEDESLETFLFLAVLSKVDGIAHLDKIAEELLSTKLMKPVADFLDCRDEMKTLERDDSHVKKRVGTLCSKKQVILIGFQEWFPTRIFQTDFPFLQKDSLGKKRMGKEIRH